MLKQKLVYIFNLSWKVSQDMSRCGKCHRECHGKCHGRFKGCHKASWKCHENVMEMSWICHGNVKKIKHSSSIKGEKLLRYMAY